jgi:hypothetical protein
MSNVTWTEIEYARRISIPDEKFFTFWSTKRSSSANRTIASKRSLISSRVSPISVELRTMLSRALSSELNPTPSSMNGETSPLTSTVPASAR